MSSKPFGTFDKDTMEKPINTSDATTRRRAPYMAPRIFSLSLNERTAGKAYFGTGETASYIGYSYIRHLCQAFSPCLSQVRV